MVRRRNSPRNAGFTLLELMITVTFLVLIGAQATTVMNSANDYSSNETARVLLQDHAQQTVDRIVYAIMSSERERLVPEAESPFFSTEVDFQAKSGVEDGEVLWADPERIELSPDGRQVIWRENPGEANENRIVWSKLVTPLFDGETPNGLDDNGNGLVDEAGMTFTVDRDMVTIRISFARPDGKGGTLTEVVTTTATCRNH